MKVDCFYYPKESMSTVVDAVAAVESYTYLTIIITYAV